jgi:hypothetical protein
MPVFYGGGALGMGRMGEKLVSHDFAAFLVEAKVFVDPEMCAPSARSRRVIAVARMWDIGR